MIDLAARKYAVVVYPGPDVAPPHNQSGGAICMGYHATRQDAEDRADELKAMSPGTTPIVYKRVDEE